MSNGGGRRGLVWIVAALMIATPGALSAEAQQATLQAQAEALVLFNQGHDLFRGGQLQAALTKFQAALPLYQEAGDRSGEARCLVFIGFVKYRLADYPGAVAAFKASLPIWQEIGDRPAEGLTLNNIGEVYRALGRYEEALAEYRAALAIAQAIGDRAGEGKALNNIGAVYNSLGRYEEAMANYQAALTVEQALGDQLREGRTLNNIGLVYDSLGRYEEALAEYRAALAIAQAIGDRAGEGATLGNIGAVYRALGRYEEALAQFQTALAIKQAIGDRAGEAATLNNIGAVYNRLGRYEEALAQVQAALAIVQAIGDRAGEAATLNNIGAVYASLGRYEEVLAEYRAALAIAQAIGDRAGEGRALHNIGAVYNRLGRYEEALAEYRAALAIAQAIGDRAGEGRTLGNIGFVHEVKGESKKAIDFYQQAVEVVESIQGEIQVEELTLAFASEQVALYARLIGLLTKSGDQAGAFAYAERARARAFLNQIGNEPVDFRRGAAGELISQEQDLRQRLIGLETALKAEVGKPFDRQSQTVLERLRTDLERTRKSHEALLTQLKLASPEYASLVSVATLSLAEVQQQVLDEQTTLIEYFVMDERVLAWVIEREGFELVPLDITGNHLRNKVTYLRNLIATRDFDTETAASLYDALFAPLKPHIRHRNLIIVPHGVLHYLPFAALWDAEKERYLLQDYTLTYAPSASVLRFLQAKRSEDRGRLLALGNPDGSLPHAAEETEAIADLYGTTALLGRRATESQVREQAGQLDVLHLAAHGVYNPVNPLFSRIELAGDEQADGNLEVHELFGLDLRGTNLVVLSACKTALGQQSEGDEIVGLTRAFLYAGTPAVVTTLWAINSEASGALMEAFYRHLRDGGTTAQALQVAQLEVIRQEKWNTPYFWAAFSLTGDSQGSWESD